jgi:hypothetical protein
MHFPRDCRRGLLAPTVGSSVLVRQPGRFLMYCPYTPALRAVLSRLEAPTLGALTIKLLFLVTP